MDAEAEDIEPKDLAGHLSRRRLILGGLSASALAASRPAASATGGVAAAQAVRIACVGDSMVDGIWGGLIRKTQQEACLRARVGLGRYGRNGTGLARADRLDWPAELGRINAQYRPTLNLISLGLNDAQPITGPRGEAIAFPSERWTDAYRERIGRMLGLGTAADAGVVWIGNPTMRDRTMQAQILALNGLVAEAVGRLASAKAAYVPPWRAALSDPDRFVQYAAGPSGDRVQIRAPDGVHFTAAGYDRIADYLMPILLGRLRTLRIELPSCPPG